MGMALTIAAILFISPLGQSKPPLVKFLIRLSFLATGYLSYPIASEHTVVIELDSSVSGLCLQDLDQDSIPHKYFPESVLGLRILGFVICLLGVVCFLRNMLEIPGYAGRIGKPVNLDTSLEAFEQRCSYTLTWQALDVETKHGEC